MIAAPGAGRRSQTDAEGHQDRLDHVRLRSGGDPMQPKDPVHDDDVEAEKDPDRDEEAVEERGRAESPGQHEGADQDRHARSTAATRPATFPASMSRTLMSPAWLGCTTA